MVKVIHVVDGGGEIKIQVGPTLEPILLPLDPMPVKATGA